MKLGIGSYTYPWAIGVAGMPSPSSPLSPEGLIEAATDVEADVVQLCDNIPLDALSEGALVRLAAAARAAGVTLEAGTRGTDPAHLRKFVAIAQVLGAHLLRTMVTESLDAAENDLREVFRDLERTGIVCALENYERHSVWDLAAMIRRIGNPQVAACLDTVNSLGTPETPSSAVQALLPLAACVHVKDFDIIRADHRMGFAVIGAPGRGRLDLPGLVDAAGQTGRDPSVILELWTPFAGTVETTAARERDWAAESMALLRRYLPR